MNTSISEGSRLMETTIAQCPLGHVTRELRIVSRVQGTSRPSRERAVHCTARGCDLVARVLLPAFTEFAH